MFLFITLLSLHAISTKNCQVGNLFVKPSEILYKELVDAETNLKSLDAFNNYFVLASQVTTDLEIEDGSEYLFRCQLYNFLTSKTLSMEYTEYFTMKCVDGEANVKYAENDMKSVAQPGSISCENLNVDSSTLCAVKDTYLGWLQRNTPMYTYQQRFAEDDIVVLYDDNMKEYEFKCISNGRYYDLTYLGDNVGENNNCFVDNDQVVVEGNYVRCKDEEKLAQIGNGIYYSRIKYVCRNLIPQTTSGNNINSVRCETPTDRLGDLTNLLLEDAETGEQLVPYSEDGDMAKAAQSFVFYARCVKSGALVKLIFGYANLLLHSETSTVLTYDNFVQFCKNECDLSMFTGWSGVIQNGENKYYSCGDSEVLKVSSVTNNEPAKYFHGMKVECIGKKLFYRTNGKNVQLKDMNLECVEAPENICPQLPLSVLKKYVEINTIPALSTGENYLFTCLHNGNTKVNLECSEYNGESVPFTTKDLSDCNSNSSNVTREKDKKPERTQMGKSNNRRLKKDTENTEKLKTSRKRRLNKGAKNSNGFEFRMNKSGRKSSARHRNKRGRL